jgi:hypothetical protein
MVMGGLKWTMLNLVVEEGEEPARLGVSLRLGLVVMIGMMSGTVLAYQEVSI